MGLLSICCRQVLAHEDFKGHHSALKCSLKRDTCFFLVLIIVQQTDIQHPRRMTSLDSVNMTIILDRKILRQ